jgi:hypothetical protein
MNVEQSDSVLNITYAEKSDGTLVWNGYELIREDYTGTGRAVPPDKRIQPGWPGLARRDANLPYQGICDGLVYGN